MSNTSVSLFLNPSVQSFPLLPRSFLGIPHLTRRYRRRSARRRIRQLTSGYGRVPKSPQLCTGGLCHFAAEHSLLRGECASGSSTLSLLPMGSLGSPHHCGPPPHPLEWWRPFWPRVLVCYIGPLSLVALMAGVASGCLPPRQVAGSQFAEWLSSTGAHHYPWL